MRAVDGAWSVEMLNRSLKCVFSRTLFSSLRSEHFRQVLHDLSQRYIILTYAARLSSMWENEIGSDDWHILSALLFNLSLIGGNDALLFCTVAIIIFCVCQGNWNPFYLISRIFPRFFLLSARSIKI